MVLPSLAESLPYVVLEAVAAAQPLVSTNVGGIPEIFGPFSDELVPPADARLLADAIASKLAQSPEQRTEHARRLAAFIRCPFSLPRMVDSVLDAYETALSARRVPAPVAPVPERV
jgi:glycosyltransferase involved in cell wall biosynthesis